MDLGRSDWLAFSEIWSLKHVRGFQTKNFIVGSFVFLWWVVFNQECCDFIQYSLLKGCCEWILIQPWTQVIDYSLPGLTWHTRLGIGISHLWISGIVVHGRCYFPIDVTFLFFLFFCYFLWLFVGWSLFFVFVFMSLDSTFSNQESILTCLLTFWLIINFNHFYYGSITSYYSILYYYIAL